MTSNAERREAAKRALEQEIANRAASDRKRKRLTIGLSILGVVVLAAGAVTVWAVTRPDPPLLPGHRAVALADEVSCEYPATPDQPAARPVEPPRTEGIRTSGEGAEDISVSMTTDRGNIGLVLHNSDSPCTVNNFLSLASQDFYNDTQCHRLTTGEMLAVLQCGDPTGQGSGGPGYSFANEFPTDQFAADDPNATTAITYPRGTLAMANAGRDTNGSQFFLVYRDSQLPPNYTVFGTIDETGLQTLDAIAEKGVQGNTPDAAVPVEDGPPAEPVTITSVRMD